VALPPGVSKQQARTNDFERDWNAARLKYLEERLAADPQDQQALTEAAAYYWYFKNTAAAEEVYQRFFATECNDSGLLNIAVWAYITHSGTNLQRAYEFASKAHSLWPRSPEVADTVAWVQYQRGYYEEALALLPPIDRPDYWVAEVMFHAGCAHYMLMEQGEAREDFQKFLASKSGFFGRAAATEEAMKCLGVLDLEVTRPRATMATLRKRLIETPDDRVALDRLGAFAEAEPRDESLLADPMVRKAMGVRAYRRADYAKAAQDLAESAKTRSTDGKLFLWLGLALKELHQNEQCADALKPAVALPLKEAQVEEANKVLESLQ
jgi:tetratricopeptide (TPR) repeat protein